MTLIISTLVAGAHQPDLAVAGIGIVLFLIGLLGIISGRLLLLVRLKLSSLQGQQSTAA